MVRLDFVLRRPRGRRQVVSEVTEEVPWVEDVEGLDTTVISILIPL